MNFKLTLATLVAVGLSGSLPAQAVPDAKPVVVPFKLLPSRHMLVEVTLNGKGPYKLIFDTGAPLNIVTGKLAKAAGVSKKGGGLAALFGGGMNTVDVTMGVGDAKADKVAAVVMDHPTVQSISDAFAKEYGPIDGLVGFPFFARFATTVDYQKKELTLTPRDYKPGNYIEDLTRTLTEAGDNAGKAKVVGPAGLWGFTLAAKAKDDSEAGVTVGEVYEGTPAAKAGLKIGDRVLTIDGRWADSLADAHVAVSLVKPGRKADVTLTRGGKPVTVSVTPAVGF